MKIHIFLKAFYERMAALRSSLSLPACAKLALVDLDTGTQPPLAGQLLAAIRQSISADGLHKRECLKVRPEHAATDVAHQGLASVASPSTMNPTPVPLSRSTHRPNSTAVRKSATILLNSSGSSRLTVWPD